ncbi:hypothetical protein [Mycobacteroides immunogenum]|nr:hypothetical protein [Mycobacteroides immunogenum]
MSDVFLWPAAYGFSGCSSMNPDTCNCATWTPTECEACGEEIDDGVDVYNLIRPKYLWMSDDARGQEWENIVWHKSCDEGSAAASRAVEENK